MRKCAAKHQTTTTPHFARADTSKSFLFPSFPSHPEVIAIRRNNLCLKKKNLLLSIFLRCEVTGKNSKYRRELLCTRRVQQSIKDQEKMCLILVRARRFGGMYNEDAGLPFTP
jgi:hypothetical protein